MLVLWFPTPCRGDAARPDTGDPMTDAAHRHPCRVRPNPSEPQRRVPHQTAQPAARVAYRPRS